MVRVSYAGRVRELEPNGNETLQQLVERQGMNPMDGSAMAVYDEDEVVSGQRASTRRTNRALLDSTCDGRFGPRPFA